MRYLDKVVGPGRSLRRRLLLNITIALSFCLGIAGAILISEFYDHFAENLDEALFLEAQEVLGQVDPGLEHFGLDPDAVRFRGVEGAYRYTVFDATGQAIVGAETSAAIWGQLSQASLGQMVKITLPGDRVGVGIRGKVNGTNVFVLASTYLKSRDEAQFHAILREIREQIWWVALGVMIILAAALFATRSALASLDMAARQAHEIDPFEIDKRLSEKQVPTELRPFVQAVNGAFDRLEQGYQAQRDFSSNVAHEIRTPLAVLRSSVDRIADDELRQGLADDLSSLDRLFEQLIDLARADASGEASFAPLDLRAVVMEQAAGLAPEALRNGQSLAVSDAPSVTVTGHAGLLGIALKNLLRNALRYAPKGTEVEIEIVQNPPAIRVLDAGPGVPDTTKASLFERFNRGKMAHQIGNGSGIGLAIVQSVARAHGALASVADRPGGGSIFSITWPDNPLT